MERLIVVHYHELGLKKGNRDFFENRLCANLRTVLQDCGAGQVRRLSGRVLVELEPDADASEVIARMRRVFGVVYFAEGWKSPASLEILEQNVWSLVEGRRFESFRIDARRADKSFPYTSMEINQRIGAYVKERSRARVDLDNAALTVWIEVLGKDAIAYVDRTPGPGGLPSSTGGKVVVLLSGGIDSPVAAWKMMKRGCTAVFVHFHSFPYTNKESQVKARQIAALLSRYQMKSKIYLVPFAEVQRHIMVETPASTRVLLYRRYMLRIAEEIARKENARVLVTGDSVGQVASQTIENLDVISRATTMPILRPLIGDDKLEIIDLARRIGTFEISIQPDQDCCSLFVPKHPETKARLVDILHSEQRLQVDDVLKKVLEETELAVETSYLERQTTIVPTET